MLSEPELLLLDEPTSALDMTSQKAVLDELLRLRKITGMTMIIVTHNLSVAARLADETAVMYAGRFVEYGKTGGILGNPYHPYTSELMRSVPVLGGSMPEGPDGFLHLADDNQQGCAYFDRCRYASDICKTNDGKLRELSQDHFTSCIGRRTYD
jgi:oligopeptide/dipeptide ABC transporter ATP-binding protein